MKYNSLFTTFALLILMCSCIEERPEFKPPSMTRPYVDLTYIRDGYGRYLNFTGVNLGGSTKVPIKREDGTYTYIGRPFPLEEADRYFRIIKDAGFNTIRLLFMWEAVEPNEKGVYDEEFLDYFDKIIAKAEEHGIYVLINMHENGFSRHLFVKYNEVPIIGEKGELMGMIGSLFPRDFSKATNPCEMNPFSDIVTGDGAPLWAVKAVLPEKAPYIGGKSWGTFKSLKFIPDVAGDLTGLLGDGTGGGLSD
ncbi:MAG: cellulase family glycosylhydrolase [Myxococcota bacterium]